MTRARSGDVWVAASKLLPRGEPLELSWEGLGCSYETHDGVKTVLQVRRAPRPSRGPGFPAPRSAGFYVGWQAARGAAAWTDPWQHLGTLGFRVEPLNNIPLEEAAAVNRPRV